MTAHELARLLLLYPDVPVCVLSDGVLREVERVRVATVNCYLPPKEGGLVGRGQVIVLDPLLEDQSGESASRSTTEPRLGPLA